MAVVDEIAAIRDCEALIVGVGRAFYNDESSLILETLVEDKFLREDVMSRRLAMSEKQARRALQFLQNEGLVSHEVAATEEKKGGHKKQIYWYCDFQKARDVVKFRLHLLKENVKEKERAASTSARFRCPSCGTRQSALDAVRFRFWCPERTCEEVKLVEEQLESSLANAHKLLAKIEKQLSSEPRVERVGIFELLKRLDGHRLPSNKPSDNRSFGLGTSEPDKPSFSGFSSALFGRNKEIDVAFESDVDWQDGDNSEPEEVPEERIEEADY
ncbi:hypothetical protein CTAYLR_006973 [Chrysophaeum taylorii]|uniref:Transcription initiation factor IIE subunit alpha N-terminal domain-containing protein n=1 Tax=Chrysophaeum taylorii TaxID=2483200 RepID=A0AAD7XJQ6_9STRA|nr:hypothetical protein CTAYLR_006973 [Chrysophaeum taylorii]